MSGTNSTLLLPSLIGDALALGAHWVYEPEAIAAKIASFDTYHHPISAYHPGKNAGDQTHYGDQTILLWRFLQETGAWDAPAFAQYWAGYWAASQSYHDKATRITLDDGRPSSSDELGGPARLAPLLDFLADQPLETRIAAAREQTALTHNSPLATDAAEFIALSAALLEQGKTFAEAFQQAAHQGSYAELAPLVMLQWVAAQNEKDALVAIDLLGQACPVPQALPSVLWLAQYHGESPVEALTLNVKAGGDSAARGMVLGLWLGARHGHEWIPETWKDSLRFSLSDLENSP